VTFIDHHNCFTIYFLLFKVETLQCLRCYPLALVGEYISHVFCDFLQQKGILSQNSCLYMPKSNCINRYLLDVSPKFWVEALLTTIFFLINRLPSHVFGFHFLFFYLFHVHPHYDYTYLYYYHCYS